MRLGTADTEKKKKKKRAPSISSPSIAFRQKKKGEEEEKHRNREGNPPGAGKVNDNNDEVLAIVPGCKSRRNPITNVHDPYDLIA